MEHIRQQSQQREREILASWATFSDSIRGRDVPEEECPIRTPFQRDRDRIIHCNSFRRLMHKTQVFLFPQGDHYRTRLTHTLEVGQVARTIARGLRLNEDLTEAIALGHDLGHTPFGHAGEYALSECASFPFVHSVQSVRIVERLERDGAGLNLTWEVRDGILCHSSRHRWAATPEGKVVRFADKIAYMNHDIDDAVRAGILSEEDLPWEVRYRLGRTKGERITTLITSIIQNSGDGQVEMGAQDLSCYQTLRDFLFQTVYHDPRAKGEEGKAKEIIHRLFEYLMAHPDRLPEDYRRTREEEGNERAVVDYISSMSDRYCVTVFEDFFIPKPWGF